MRRRRSTSTTMEPSKKSTKELKRPKQNQLRILPLGGNEESGRNLTVLEFDRDIIIIDAGIQFPTADMPGIDYVVPNISYLKGKEKNIRGIFLTAAHLENSGALPYLIETLGKPPVYSTELILALVSKRYDKEAKTWQLRSTNVRDLVKAGVFQISFFYNQKQIPVNTGLIIETPAGRLVYSNHLRSDSALLLGKLNDFIHLKNNRPTLAVLADSWFAGQSRKGFTEFEIQTQIEEIFRKSQGRLVFGTVATNLNRVQQIIETAEKLNRLVFIYGQLLNDNIAMARALGYLKVKSNTIVSLEDARRCPANRLVIIGTGFGSGEDGLYTRLADKTEELFYVQPGDTMIFSSHVIPGNERSVQLFKDWLCRQGAEIVQTPIMDIRSSGNIKNDELTPIIRGLNPTYYFPIHGHYSYLRMHAEQIVSCGFQRNRIFILDNGQAADCSKQSCLVSTQRANTDFVYVDGLGVGDISHVVLRDRQMMADDGMIVVIATVDRKTGRLLQSPDLISRGFIYVKDNNELVDETRKKVVDLFSNYKPGSDNDLLIKNKIRNELGKYFFQKTERQPLVLPVVIEV